MDSEIVNSYQFTPLRQGFGGRAVHAKSKSASRELKTPNQRFMRPGVTLIEILVGLAIFGFITVLVASLYFAQFRLFSSQNTSIDIASQNKLALDEMTNQIRESQSVAGSC